jgi:hypothetical protein
MVEKRNTYRLLVGEPEAKRRRWADYIKMDLGELGWGYVDWIGLAQDRNWWKALVNFVMDLRVSKKCWETMEWAHNWWHFE